MPEFVLNTPPSPREMRTAKAWGFEPKRAPHPFHDLDCLAQGYVEALFFTNGDTGDSRESLLNEWGVECLTVEACASIAADCAAFESTVASDGRTVADILASCDDYESEMAGRDFWFTRQGHGVGFTDRRELDDESADLLDACARRFRESYVEAYRRKIHVR